MEQVNKPEIIIHDGATTEQRAALEVFEQLSLATDSGLELTAAVRNILDTDAHRKTNFDEQTEALIDENEEIISLLKQKNASRNAAEQKDLSREIVRKRFMIWAGQRALAAVQEDESKHDVA